ncbi:MAG TPA: nuclear transport factor 2 family protein [Actinomycetota bacterium]|nr:nuclear transport factor 2 family protein [Actinomycetota bacterium]
MGHPNEDFLRRGYDAFNKGDLDTVMSLFSDDVVLHIGGKSQLAGDYKGKQEYIGALGKLVELSGGTFKEEVHDILANDRHGVALSTTTAERDGKRLNQKSLEVHHIDNGKITESWAWVEDQDEDADFWG